MADLFGVVRGVRSRLNEDKDESTKTPVAKLYPHVPNLVTFIDHNKPLPWTKRTLGVLMFADISGFTALCERYSSMSNAGTDQLTTTLNEYLGALVELILTSNGDVLKFAGDAILALWTATDSDVQSVLETVVKCCVDIQDKCGLWETDIGITLTVKMGVSVGDISISFIGNDEYRHYVECGPAVDDVKMAEKFCQSGYTVLSPSAWKVCDHDKFQYVHMSDGEHVRVICLEEESEDSFGHVVQVEPSECPYAQGRRFSAVTEPVTKRRGSLSLPGTSLLNFTARRQSVDLGSVAKFSKLLESPEVNEVSPMKDEESEAPVVDNRTAIAPQKRYGGPMMSKLKRAILMLGPMPKKLRLYVLSPVLKKLDDGQPLEYLSEMRQISVIFMNLTLAETTDTAGLMQNLFEIVYKQIQKFQGCLNKIFLFDKGCSFLVIFGLPGYKHEKDRAYALQCSAGMAEELQKDQGVSQVSIGVTTGTAFCGVVGHKDRHEYSVIGRKVNMAARLMMHYPGTITCDDDTFQGSRMPSQDFEVVPLKMMKGLQNVGTLRRFVANAEVDITQIHDIKQFQYPILGREVELRIFTDWLNNKQLEAAEAEETRMLVFEADSGMGKTRILEAVTTKALDEGIRVVSCSLSMDDANKPYILAKMLLHMLFTNAGLTDQLDEEKDITDDLKRENLLEYLPLLNDILGRKMSRVSSKTTKDKLEWRTALHDVVNCIVSTSLKRTGLTLFAVDNIHHADAESWGLLADLQSHSKSFCVATMRPPHGHQRLSKGCMTILSHPSARKVTFRGLESKFMCALACQILDVGRIPKEINRILVEKSHGEPSWCDQLLQNLITNKQLLIVDDDPEQRQNRDATIGPPPIHIIKRGLAAVKEEEQPTTSDNLPESEPPKPRTRRQSIAQVDTLVSKQELLQTNINIFNELQATEKALQRDSIADSEVTESLMVGLLTSKTDDESTQICILDPGLKPEDLMIPESVKDMMIARLDSLRASEQLVVKCASVLGVSFHRKTLTEILPNQIGKRRADRRIDSLLTSRVFLCGSAHSRQDAKDLGYQPACDCTKATAGQSTKIQCSFLRFQNPMMQETVYDLLLENQRINLHINAAVHIDAMANKYRVNIPHFLLGRESATPATPCEVETDDRTQSGSLDEREPNSSNLESDLNEEQRWLKLCATDGSSTIQDDFLDDILWQHTNTSGDLREKSLQKLSPLYQMIATHWRNAMEKYKLLCVLVEATFAALALEQPIRASSLLQEATTAHTDFQNTDKTKYAYHPDDRLSYSTLRAKLQRLQGQVNQQQSFMLEAKDNYIQALRCLRKRQPTGKRAVSIALSWRLRVEKSSLGCQSCSGGNRREYTEKDTEQLYCLRSLYQVYKDIQDDNAALLTALQQLSKTHSYRCSEHQAILAYTATIEQCRRRNWHDLATDMERQLFQRCKQISGELTTDDLQLLAVTYGESSMYSFTFGDINEALLSGMFSVKICKKLGTLDVQWNFLPTLVQAQLTSLKIVPCLESLYNLRTAAKHLDDKKANVWFYCCCLDALLDAGYPVESYHMCMMFACWLLKEAKGLESEEEDLRLSNYLFIRIAVWYCRKRSFVEADRWFQIAIDMQRKEFDSFFSVQSQARHIESLLLTLCQARRGNMVALEEKIYKAITKEFTWMRTALKYVPSLRPRFLHLVAYLYALTKNLKRCKHKIQQCAKLAKKQGNWFELRWSQYNFKQWTRTNKPKVIRDSVWLSFSDGHAVDWTVATEVTEDTQFYPWPIPGSLSAKK